jgi:hypothetical protein
MIKHTFIGLLLTLSSVAMAESCFPLYEKVAEEIQTKGAHDEYVGGQLYVNQGQLGYWPGMKVSGHVDNWSQELVDAIKWGPFIWSANPDDPRKEWLEAFRKSIKDECKLPKENYDTLRAMLKELMEDGSFCPGNKTFEPKFLKGKSEFKKVLKEAVKDQKFAHYCQDKAVQDDSSRLIKDVSEKAGKENSGKASGKQ